MREREREQNFSGSNMGDPGTCSAASLQLRMTEETERSTAGFYLRMDGLDHASAEMGEIWTIDCEINSSGVAPHPCSAALHSMGRLGAHFQLLIFLVFRL